MSEASDSNLERQADALVRQVMPDAYGQMMRARAAQDPAPATAPQPTVTVALISPEDMKQPGAREQALASLVALAYAAAVNGYQRALAGNGVIADAHLTQAARQSLTAASLIEALDGASKRSKRTVPVRSSRETWNAYHRDLMRKRSALRRLDA